MPAGAAGVAGAAGAGLGWAEDVCLCFDSLILYNNTETAALQFRSGVGKRHSFVVHYRCCCCCCGLHLLSAVAVVC